MSTLVGSGILPFRRRATDGAPAAPGIWSPLKNPAFVAFLGGSLIGSFGARMGEITATWFMTELTTSPLLISLVTTAFSLPGFLLALPAGVLGDVFDRRRLLFASLTLASITMAILALLAIKGWAGPAVLLVACGVVGLFAAITSTTMDAILPQIVARRDLEAAIALSSIRYHLSRAIGPVLGGLLISVASIGHSFLLSGLVPLAFVSFVLTWRAPEDPTALPAERMGAALRAGLRYVGHAPQLTAVLIRVIAFIGVGSAMWGLFPAYVRHHLGFDAFHYGLLFGTFGLGGMLGSAAAFGMSKTRSGDAVLGAATLAFAVNLFLITRTRNVPLLAVTLFVGGLAWSAGLVGLKTAVQMAAPEWVRARISAIYLFSLHGAVSAGGVVWGTIASYYGTPDALRLAGVAMVVTLCLAFRYRLVSISAVTEDHVVPRMAPLELPAAVAQEGSAFMITLEYTINPQHSGEFEELMHEVGAIRRRSGATFWGLFVDAAVPEKYSEYFLVESGLDARRMHDRMTDPERETLTRAHAFHTHGSMPITHHHQMICHGGAWEGHRPGR